LKQVGNITPRSSYIPASRESHIVTFRLGTEIYGVEIEKVKEVINLVEITPAPAGPDFLEGTITLREATIPVIDLRKRFHLQAAVEGRPRIFILTNRTRLLGAIVDDFSSVIVLDSIHYEQVPPALLDDNINAYVDAMTTTEQGVIMIISPAGLLNGREDAELKVFETSLGKEQPNGER
jgi:purine-binding chemotaxis protein CheW